VRVGYAVQLDVDHYKALGGCEEISKLSQGEGEGLVESGGTTTNSMAATCRPGSEGWDRGHRH
jgi:hypothetical protein